MNTASKTKAQASIPATIALECKTSSISDGKGKAVRSRVTIGLGYIELLIKELENHASIKQFTETCLSPQLRAVFHSPSWGTIPAMTTMRAIAAPDVPKTDAVKLNVNVKNGVHGLEGLLVISGTTTGEKLKNLEPAKLLSAVTDAIKKLDERQWTEVTKDVKVESKPTKANPTSSIVVPIFATIPAVKPNTNTEEVTMVAKPAVKPVAEAPAPALSLQAAIALVTQQAEILAKRDAIVQQIEEKSRLENENQSTLQSLSESILEANARIAEITALVDQLVIEQEQLGKSVAENERKRHEISVKLDGTSLASLEEELAALPQFTPVEEAFIRPYIQKK